MFHDALAARLAEMGSAPDYPRLVAEVLGIRNAPAELARRLVAHALVVEDRRETWRDAGRRICKDAPDAPGVYVFLDGTGRALYVGKAVSLRRRLHAHFADRRWLTLKPSLVRVTRAEWHVVGSELEALLREAMWIRELRPAVNVQIGAPALRTRAVPRALLRDSLLILPSIDPNAAELVGARPNGSTTMLRAMRRETDRAAYALPLWEFFQDGTSGVPPAASGLAPLVFSWLARRGQGTTRLDPGDARSATDLHRQLHTLLHDPQLFTERLILSDAKHPDERDERRRAHGRLAADK